jgi:hypothetical protein
MLLEVVALDVFHHQVGGIAMALRVVHADDVGMLQTRSRTGLGAEARLVIGRRLCRQVLDLDGLDGHAAIEIRIPRLVDHAHGTLAQHPHNVVTGPVW